VSRAPSCFQCSQCSICGHLQMPAPSCAVPADRSAKPLFAGRPWVLAQLIGHAVNEFIRGSLLPVASQACSGDARRRPGGACCCCCAPASWPGLKTEGETNLLCCQHAMLPVGQGRSPVADRLQRPRAAARARQAANAPASGLAAAPDSPSARAAAVKDRAALHSHARIGNWKRGLHTAARPRRRPRATRGSPAQRQLSRAQLPPVPM
jgi:hypothetical protein